MCDKRDTLAYHFLSRSYESKRLLTLSKELYSLESVE